VGFIAEEMNEIIPEVVIWENGQVDGIDYAYLTAVLTRGVQELDLKIEGLEERIAALESGGSGDGNGSGGISALGEFAVEFFSSGLKSMSDGVAYLRGIVTEKLTVGSPEKRTGITLYDEVTGEPYCVSVANGVQKIVPGECSIFEASSQVASAGGSNGDEGGSEDTPLPAEDGNAENSADPVPPSILLNGSAEMTLNVGDIYTELGAIVTDNVSQNMTATISGSVDILNSGIYILTYNASDEVGNSAEEKTRTVTVVEVELPVEESAPSPETPTEESPTPETPAEPAP